MVDLSVIIVSWNAKEFLSKCLQSLIVEIDEHNWEVIVVDNASSDGSQELVRNKFPHVQLICNDNNLGFARANNIGIRQSRGEYLFLINSDVIVLKNCFRQMVAYMLENPNVGLLGPKILNADGSLQRSCFGLPTVWNTFCRALALDNIFPKVKMFCGREMSFWAHDKIRNVEMLNGCFWMVRRKALETVGLLDENFFMYGEDADWCKRFGMEGWGVVFFPDAEAIHYGGASSANAPVRFYLEMQKADLLYWKKHHNRLGQISYQCIMGVHHIVRLAVEPINYLIRPTERNKTLFKIRRNIVYIQWRLGFSNVK